MSPDFPSALAVDDAENLVVVRRSFLGKMLVRCRVVGGVTVTTSL